MKQNCECFNCHEYDNFMECCRLENCKYDKEEYEE